MFGSVFCTDRSRILSGSGHARHGHHRGQAELPVRGCVLGYMLHLILGAPVASRPLDRDPTGNIHGTWIQVSFQKCFGVFYKIRIDQMLSID